jgi:carboxypeptidase PM20D1
VIIRIMMANGQTAAMLSTTSVFTMTGGGTAHNVLPHTAECTVNVRILQDDSSDAVLKRFQEIGIPFTAETILRDEPTKASDLDSQGMKHLKSCIASVFPDAVITPYLMTGGTDCRHYEQVTENAYRFLPARVSERELELIHGDGEYLSLQNLQSMVEFYTLFLRGIT